VINLACQQLKLHAGGGFSTTTMTPEVTNKSKPRTSSQSPLDQPVVTFGNESNLEIMPRLSKKCVQTGSGKQQLHDGGKQALEWITAKHSGDEALSKNLVHHMARQRGARRQNRSWPPRTFVSRSSAVHTMPCSQCYIESHFKDKAHLAALAFKTFGNVSYLWFGLGLGLSFGLGLGIELGLPREAAPGEQAAPRDSPPPPVVVIAVVVEIVMSIVTPAVVAAVGSDRFSCCSPQLDVGAACVHICNTHKIT
jgi:hypothetical protein